MQKIFTPASDADENEIKPGANSEGENFVGGRHFKNCSKKFYYEITIVKEKNLLSDPPLKCLILFIFDQKNLLGKLFASSSFYSPTIHPTVEDQVELARKISHSLSDTNNQQSKGQSMYVNRKKRSVKWIHDDGHEEERFVEGDLCFEELSLTKDFRFLAPIHLPFRISTVNLSLPSHLMLGNFFMN